MQAVHWVRSRQEERELAYWLSIVAYDHRDQSINNRIYLIYLVFFFSAWIFVTLTFFAGGIPDLLRLINPDDPRLATTLLMMLLLGVWNVFALRQSLKRSPVVFSEQDAVLICQMPVSRRQLTLRWLLMPWLKSAIPFWLVAIALGFSIAEISLPDAMAANRVIEYSGYGLRSWLGLIPVQLGLFLLQWAVGILRLQKDYERRWLAWSVMTTAIVFIAFLLVSMLDVKYLSSMPWDTLLEVIIFPLQGGFGNGSLLVSLLSSGLFSIVMLGMLTWISGAFSLSRAAQETQDIETLNSALKYGFTTYAHELQTKQRLGVKRAPSQLPAPTGAVVLVWKDILQSQRSFQFPVLTTWFAIIGAMLSFSFLPDFSSRALMIAIWVIQMGKVSVTRLRSDLSCWSLVRQLPISHKKFLLYDLNSSYFLSVMVSLIGLGFSSIISGTPVGTMAVLVPGIAAGVAGMAAFDVIRRSRSNLLLNGSVPDVSGAGILLGLLCAFVPLLINTLLPGIAGVLLAILASLSLGVTGFDLAVRTFRHIDLA